MDRGRNVRIDYRWTGGNAYNLLSDMVNKTRAKEVARGLAENAVYLGQRRLGARTHKSRTPVDQSRCSGASASLLIEVLRWRTAYRR
jgi:hypothetical protein